LPLFRSGNNSDTCLIMPDGEVTGLLRDPLTGYPFVRGAKGYDVPVWNRAAQTFYVRYGDVFAWGCAFASLCVFAVVFSLRIRGKRRQLQSLQQEAGG
jgi:apolipoprotein N-acyltransferase